MLKKMLLAGAVSLLVSAGAFAADVLAMSLNFYDNDGNVTVAGDLPEGVMMKKRIRFSNKKLPGYAYPLAIEIDRAPSVDLAFKIEGSGEFVVSVNPVIWEGGKITSTMKVKCTEFVLNGKARKAVPFTFDKWFPAGKIKVKDGDTVTIKATFEKVE